MEYKEHAPEELINNEVRDSDSEDFVGVKQIHLHSKYPQQ